MTNATSECNQEQHMTRATPGEHFPGPPAPTTVTPPIYGGGGTQAQGTRHTKGKSGPPVPSPWLSGILASSLLFLPLRDWEELSKPASNWLCSALPGCLPAELAWPAGQQRQQVGGRVHTPASLLPSSPWPKPPPDHGPLNFVVASHNISMALHMTTSQN